MSINPDLEAPYQRAYDHGETFAEAAQEAREEIWDTISRDGGDFANERLDSPDVLGKVLEAFAELQAGKVEAPAFVQKVSRILNDAIDPAVIELAEKWLDAEGESYDEEKDI